MKTSRKKVSNTGLVQPLSYSSSAMFDRRERILKETRRMVAEDGVEGFTIRGLSRRAEVAQRTLYNAFTSKDRILTMAITEAIDEVHKNTTYTEASNTLRGVVERLLAVNKRNFLDKNYTRAVVYLFFSQKPDEEVWKVLWELGARHPTQWLDVVEANGDIQPWASKDDLLYDIVNVEFRIIGDWTNGRIPDNNFLFALVTGFLRVIAGSLRGGSRTEVEELLLKLSSEGSIDCLN